MRRLLILVLVATVWLVPTALAATPEPSVQPTITGQELADGLGQWDGYDFQDAGDASPGALRTGPSDSADAADPYGADGTLLILPPLDSPAHAVLSVRLSSLASPRIWDNYQHVMDELAIDQADQQAVYGALGQVVAAAYASVDNQEQTHVASLEAGPYRVLLQSTTNGWEGLAGDEPAPIFSMPDGGLTMEILALDEASVVIPIPEPTPTPTPVATPKRTPKPTPSRHPPRTPGHRPGHPPTSSATAARRPSPIRSARAGTSGASTGAAGASTTGWSSPSTSTRGWAATARRPSSTCCPPTR